MYKTVKVHIKQSYGTYKTVKEVSAGHRTEDKWTTLGDVKDRVFSTAVEVHIRQSMHV